MTSVAIPEGADHLRVVVTDPESTRRLLVRVWPSGVSKVDADFNGGWMPAEVAGVEVEREGGWAE